MLKDFGELKRNLKKDFTGFEKVKVALLGDSATQLLAQALRATGYEKDLDIQLWEADFNQIESSVYDHHSGLYEFAPQIVIIYKSSHKLLQQYNKLSPWHYSSLADKEMELVNNLTACLSSRLDVTLIYYNYAEIDDAVFGNFALKTEQSFLFQLRKLNYQLLNYALAHSNFHPVDLSSIQNQRGKKECFKPTIYVQTDLVLSVHILPQVAARTIDLIAAIKGKIKKCLILDLDNTLWGGIIGDDGIENIKLGSLGIGKAFTEFQYWLKKLRNRGIILAVCSKNTESVAKEPFTRHPDMVLHLDDIAVFVANWENKADNIRYIQSVLNIGFDTIVFLDDNPFERQLIREQIPGLTVPELPEDPAEYLEYLYPLQLFETLSFSDEDLARTEQYQTEAKRNAVRQQFTNIDDYLRDLDMTSLVEPFNKYNTPRAAQLTNRSNQFNLRTIRYSETDIEKLSKLDGLYGYTFTLEDKFGDNGLICVVVLKAESSDTLFIDTWLMSCRVLKRGMENFVLNTVVDAGRSRNYRYLKGEYIQTEKNELVKNHYADLGFKQNGSYWLLKIEDYRDRKCFIRKK